MEALSHSLCRNNNLANLLEQTSQSGLNAQYGVNTRTKVKAEVEITTAEGDRVTLLSRSKAETAYASYDSQGMLTGKSGATSIYQIVTTNNVAIEVEGNLSEEELADIQNLLQSVEDIFMDVVSGDWTMEEDLTSSLSLDSMSTLSHFDAELKYSQKIEGYGISTGGSGHVPEETASQELAAPDVATLMAFKAKTKASLHLSGTRLTMAESALNANTSVLPVNGSSLTETVQTAGTSGTEDLPSIQPALSEPVMNSVSMINMDARLRTSIKVRVAQGLLHNVPPEVSATPQGPSVQAPSDANSAQASPDSTKTGASASSSITGSRVNLVEDFAAFIRQTSLHMNTASSILTQFIPSLIDALNNNYILDDNQQKAVTQMSGDILNAAQDASPEVTQ